MESFRSHPVIRRVSTLLASCAIVMLLTGCVIRTPAAANRLDLVDIPARLEASAWPPRSVAVDPILFASVSKPGAVVSLGAYGEGFLYEFGFPMITPTRVDGTEVGSSGVAAVMDDATDDAPTFVETVPGESWDLTHNLLFVSSPTEIPAFRTGGARVTYWPDGRRSDPVVVEGLENATFIGIRTPDTYPNRGMVVYLSSILGISDAEAKLIHSMRRNGWAVIVVTPSADIYSETVFIVPEESAGRDASHSGTRVPVQNDGDQDESVDGVDQAARRIAMTMDNHLAERVYAVESALEFVHAHLPEIRREPLVLIGGSAGALNLPALAVRLEEQVDAAVIIGGGADFFRIINESPLAQGRLKIRWPDGRPERRDRERLASLVRSYSRLDPYHTAPFLGSTPVLLLHAMYDAIIPTATGDLLHQRLGEPERWKFRTGHYGLFFLLPGQSERIVQWIADVTGS